MTEILQQVVASCSGATVTALFMTPLDVVKIRLQAQTKGFIKGECFIYCNGLMDHLCICLNGDTTVGSQRTLWKPIPNVKFTGMLDALIKIPRVEGITSLWSGLPPTLVMALPSTVIYLTSYDQLKSHMGYVDGKSHSLMIPLVCAAVARAGAVTVISPLELIRTKMQSERMTYRQLGTAIRSAVSSGGVISLWRGWSPLMWRDVPFSAIYFTVYEFLKGFSMQYRQSETVPFHHNLVFGAFGGIVAGVLTLPFDVVKTHRQLELGTNAMNIKAQGGHFQVTTFKVLKSLREKHGFQSWFAGIGPRVLKVSPACAVMISSYEYCKRLFAKHKALHD